MRRTGWQHRTLPIPRSTTLGAERLLLGLVLQAERYPDNVTDTARRLRTTRNTARRWRNRLVELGLVRRRDQQLELDVAAYQQWREMEEEAFRRDGLVWACDGLPWALIRTSGATKNATHVQLLACAVLASEAMRRSGFIRSDFERSRLACVSESTVAAAREVMVARGLIRCETVRRGAAKRLVRLQANPTIVHGEPLGEETANRLAQRAQRGQLGRARRREAAAGVGNTHAAGVGNRHGNPDSYAGTKREQPKPQPRGEDVAAASSVQRAEAEALRENWDQSLAQLTRPKKRRQQLTAEEQQKQQRLRQGLAQFMDDGMVQKLQKMPDASAVRQLLLAAGAYDNAPKRLEESAGLLVLKYGRRGMRAWPMLLQVICDVILDDVDRLGAVTATRCQRLASDSPKPVIAAQRRSWTLAEMMEAVRRHVGVAA